MSKRRSSSSGVFSMMGITKVSRSVSIHGSIVKSKSQRFQTVKPTHFLKTLVDSHSQLKALPIPPIFIPLIISWWLILNSLPGQSRVTITACWECVCIQAPASLWSYALKNKGVHADCFNGFSGERKCSRVLRSRTKMSSGWIRSFCTPAEWNEEIG